MRALVSSIKQTLQVFSSRRKLWLPFVVTALVEAFLLLLIWLAPQSPFSAVLSPPIQFFSGDRFLHYPWHLWYMYHAMKHTNLIAATLVGAFMTGLACAMVAQQYQRQTVSLRDILLSKRVKYLRVSVLWLVTWGFAKAAMQLLAFVAPRTGVIYWAGLIVMVALQSLLVYAIPVAVFENVAWWRALVGSVREALRHPLSTLLATCLCNAIVIVFGFLFSERRVAVYMQQVAPEIAVLFVVARLVVWTTVDLLLTLVVCHLWWQHRSGQSVAAVIDVKSAQAEYGKIPGNSVAA